MPIYLKNDPLSEDGVAVSSATFLLSGTLLTEQPFSPGL